MADVTIPQGMAKGMAGFLRAYVRSNTPDNPGADSWAKPYLQWADLLDPPAPTLRKQIAHMLGDGFSRERATDYATADAVLAVVAAWLAAQPLAPRNDAGLIFGGDQRDHDVCLLRGES